jgi:hypothetical protein
VYKRQEFSGDEIRKSLKNIIKLSADENYQTNEKKEELFEILRLLADNDPINDIDDCNYKIC